MLFHITYEINTCDRDEAQHRFTSTGAPPPEGVKMLGRYHSVAGLHGFILAESESAEALFTWTQSWTDLLNFDITPVIEDEAAAKIIGA